MLRTFWPTLGGLALIVIALLGGFLLPVAKDCPGAFLGYQAMLSRTGTFAACKDPSLPITVVWLAVLIVGAVGILVGLVVAYRSLQPQTPTSRVSTQPFFGIATQPEHGLQHAGEPVVGLVPGRDAGGAVQPVERRPRKWPFVVAIAVLALGVLSLGAGYAYSTNSADQWRAAADKTSRDLGSMTAERNGLSEKNTSLTTQLTDANNKLNTTTTQLNDANARIRSLANEKAQVGDEAATYAGLVVDSQKVSTGMSTCIDKLQNLQTYLVNYTDYDPASLISYVRGINSQCNTARADSDSLTQTIQGLVR
jgi:hypothetical protein